MNVENRLVEELCTKHGCHTVILYGSRARGDFSEESDHDVLGVRADGPACRDARPWEGSFLDAFIYSEAALETLDDGMARLAGGKVLLERDGFGAELVASIQERAIEYLEAPILRVTGFDTPFPYTLEHEYMPNADRVLAAIRKTLEW